MEWWREREMGKAMGTEWWRIGEGVQKAVRRDGRKEKGKPEVEKEWNVEMK